MAQKILIGRNLKKRKRALFGTDAHSNLLKIRKIDHLNKVEKQSENESEEIVIETKNYESEELQQIINELRLRNVQKRSSKRIFTSYGIIYRKKTK